MFVQVAGMILANSATKLLLFNALSARNSDPRNVTTISCARKHESLMTLAPVAVVFLVCGGLAQVRADFRKGMRTALVACFAAALR